MRKHASTSMVRRMRDSTVDNASGPDVARCVTAVAVV